MAIQGHWGDSYKITVELLTKVNTDRFKQPHHWEINGKDRFYMLSRSREELPDPEIGDILTIKPFHWMLEDRHGIKNYIVEIKKNTP